MKRIGAILLSLIIVCFPSAVTERKALCRSYAYACVVSDGAAFYADAALIIERFVLPESYFVRIISTGVECSRVVYMDGGSLPSAEGYVKNADLYFTDQAPVSPYPDLSLTVAVDEVMFADVTKSQPKCVLVKSTVAHYYGETEYNGEKYIYVYALGNVGYVKKSSFEPFSLDLHPSYSYGKDPVENSATFSEDHNNARAESRVSASQMIIIALLIVGVLCMLFLLLRPEQKTLKKADYYDDE